MCCRRIFLSPTSWIYFVTGGAFLQDEWKTTFTCEALSAAPTAVAYVHRAICDHLPHLQHPIHTPPTLSRTPPLPPPLPSPPSPASTAAYGCFRMAATEVLFSSGDDGWWRASCSERVDEQRVGLSAIIVAMCVTCSTTGCCVKTTSKRPGTDLITYFAVLSTFITPPTFLYSELCMYGMFTV